MWFKQTPKSENADENTSPASKTYQRIRRRKGTIPDRSRATTVLKAMSNIQRLQILSHLIDNKELSVKQLEEMIQTLSQSALSQHLGRLRRANILKARRDSQMVYYSINDDNVQTIMALLNNMYESDPVFSSKD
jgi:DNA-binding transcriptional ArsR family regulator